MEKLSENLNANVRIKKVSKNGKTYNNIVVVIPTEKEAISFQVRLAFNNPKLLYKICKQLESEK